MMNNATDRDARMTREVDEAITSRRYIRAFLPTAVPHQMIVDILQVSSRAPSGTNIQPWQVHVLTGQSKNILSAKLLAAHHDAKQRAEHVAEYQYYPQTWVSPYLERRRKVGWDLYGLLKLTREDKAGIHHQHGRNYLFFDAPVGLMFTIDRVLERGSWIEYGMFMQTIMIAARARGLDTCPQAAFTPFHRIVADHLELPESAMLVCGMSLGYADPARIENSLETEREAVQAFTRFYS
jgi:nitroreductase